MRRILFLIGGLCALALTARAQSDDAGAVSSNLTATPVSTSPDLIFNARALSPLPNPSLPPAPETRPTEQLEAILAAYVGDWRGETNIHIVGSLKLIHFPIEIVYTMTGAPGQRVVEGTATYSYNNQSAVEKMRLFVVQGRIVEEISAGRAINRLIARVRGESLVWYSLDPNRPPTDLCETETIQLTASGGDMNIQGYEVAPNANGPPSISCESTDLKLQK
jgi:hypothetical protein